MPKTYYLLLSRDDANDPWAIEFGAWDRGDVSAERQDRRDHDVKASNLKIVAVAGGSKKACDAAVAKLNASLNVQA